MSDCTGTWRILLPYAHRMAEVSRNKRMPLALDCSKNILWPLLKTNSCSVSIVKRSVREVGRYRLNGEIIWGDNWVAHRVTHGDAVMRREEESSWLQTAVRMSCHRQTAPHARTLRPSLSLLPTLSSLSLFSLPLILFSFPLISLLSPTPPLLSLLLLSFSLLSFSCSLYFLPLLLVLSSSLTRNVLITYSHLHKLQQSRHDCRVIIPGLRHPHKQGEGVRIQRIEE